MFWHEKELDNRHTDPKNYKWRYFYYNPADKRLIVPKKNPNMGATINFADRRSILFFLPAILLVAIVIVLFLAF